MLKNTLSSDSSTKGELISQISSRCSTFCPPIASPVPAFRCLLNIIDIKGSFLYFNLTKTSFYRLLLSLYIMTSTAEKNRYLSLSMKIYRSRRSSPLLILFILAIILLLGAAPAAAHAQSSVITGADVQKIANAVLTLMGYSLTPDVTTGSLSLADVSHGESGFFNDLARWRLYL